MFKLEPNPTIEAEVAIPVPGGAPAKVAFIFRHKGRRDLQRFLEAAQGREDPESIAEIVADWRGGDTPYLREALDALLDGYPAAAILEDRIKALAGAAEKTEGGRPRPLRRRRRDAGGLGGDGGYEHTVACRRGRGHGSGLRALPAVPVGQRAEVFAQVRVMEDEALRAMAEG